MAEPTPQHRRNYTLIGLLALPLWASTFAVARSLSEQLGGLLTGALVHLIAGTMGCLVLYRRPGEWRRLRDLPRRFWLLAGVPFIAYTPLLYLALDWSRDRRQVLAITLVNYIWPALTLVFSLPILGRRARPWLWPGLMLALAGTALATISGNDWNWPAIRESLTDRPAPYILTLLAATAWPLYSNFTRRCARHVIANPIPILLLATGLTSLLLFTVTGATSTHASGEPWGWRIVAELIYQATFPVLVASLCWDTAMRRGDAVIVASASHGTPLLAVVVSGLYLGVSVPHTAWLACALVIAGAMICRMSVIEPPAAGS